MANFDGKHIHIAIHKTKTQPSIKLPNKAIEIINKYHSKAIKQTDFIFPTLPNGTDLNDPKFPTIKFKVPPLT